MRGGPIVVAKIQFVDKGIVDPDGKAPHPPVVHSDSVKVRDGKPLKSEGALAR